MSPLPIALAALTLAITHLLSHRIRRLEGTPRSRWLSAAGGSSVAYVFLHLLPELAEAEISKELALDVGRDHVIWLFALFGLLLFYALEVWSARRAERDPVALAHHHAPGRLTYWVHLGAYLPYNFIVGYLLTHREEESLSRLALFTLAMVLHFIVSDHGLRHQTHGSWLKIGRFLLAGALLAGCGLGFVFDLSASVVSMGVAFLGGSVVLNVLKEELPEERESRLLPFLLGAAIYAALLLAAHA